jgi:alpha-amylase
MKSICVYFQVHQPYRLRKFSFFDRGSRYDYFDEEKNATILRRIAHKCYLPTNKILLNLFKTYKDQFKVCFSLSGTLIEQLDKYAPEALESFQELVATGCVEIFQETYYHSLSSLFDVKEFKDQVALHGKIIHEKFGVKPEIFRNTELIFNNEIASIVNSMGFKGVLAEGVDEILEWRSPHFLYSVPEIGLPLLLKSYKRSDDIAFRFSNKEWQEYPLTAEKYLSLINKDLGETGQLLNLFMDYETFGEHQQVTTGIFEFLKALPPKLLENNWQFLTASEVIKNLKPIASLSIERVTSWADEGRDVTAWIGNKIQQTAITQVYELAEAIKLSNDRNTLSTWRMLQTADHFYYMCTKWASDRDVHSYFSPYENPYEAFINFMNVLRDFKSFFLGESNVSIQR